MTHLNTLSTSDTDCRSSWFSFLTQHRVTEALRPLRFPRWGVTYAARHRYDDGLRQQHRALTVPFADTMPSRNSPFDRVTAPGPARRARRCPQPGTRCPAGPPTTPPQPDRHEAPRGDHRRSSSGASRIRKPPGDQTRPIQVLTEPPGDLAAVPLCPWDRVWPPFHLRRLPEGHKWTGGLTEGRLGMTIGRQWVELGVGSALVMERGFRGTAAGAISVVVGQMAFEARGRQPSRCSGSSGSPMSGWKPDGRRR